MPTRVQVLIATVFVALPHGGAQGQGPAEPLTSCEATAVLQRAADTVWVRDSLGRFDARIAGVLPNAGRTIMRADVGRGDYAGAMQAIRTAAASAFEAAGAGRVPAGFRETFFANADSVADVLSRLEGATGSARASLLASFDAGRFRETRRNSEDGFTTFYFATPSQPGFRIDPKSLSSPAFEAVCWSLVSADLLLSAFTAPLVEITTRRLAAIQQEWKTFDDYRRPETALEFALNHLRWKQSLDLHPPGRQLVFLHPVAAVVADGLGKGSERSAAYGLEVLGGVWYPAKWKWKNYVGLSVISVGTDEGPVRVGAYIHASRYGSAGIVQSVAGPRKLAFVTSVDLARFIWKDDKALAEFASMQQSKAKGDDVLSAVVASKVKQ